MSVIIRGMEMPQRCGVCRMLEGNPDDGLCHAAQMWLDDDRWEWFVYPEGDIDDSKPLNCPLIPVPLHGRLIDANAFEREVNESVFLTQAFKDAFNLRLQMQPAVIEAEEGEE